MNHSLLARRALCLLGCSSLAACGWVDDTGRQRNTAPQIVLDQANTLQENSVVAWPLRRFDADGNVSWVGFEQTASGAQVSGCAGQFEPLSLAPTLREACQPALDDDACQVRFDVGPSEVSVHLPALRRPAALRYKVEVQDDDGASTERSIDLCLVTLSEAPVARDDADYAVSYLEQLEHSGSRYDEQCRYLGGSGVLANDSDDFDHREGWTSGQACLRAELVEGPRYAASFELRSDGGFRYHSSGAAGPGSEDSFRYRVSDGRNHSEVATARIAIVGDNAAPVALDPRLQTNEDQPLEIALGQLARDPEGTALRVESVTQPSVGRVLVQDAVLRFEPGPQFHGRVDFDVELVDAAGLAVRSRVRVDVLEVNDAPAIDGLPPRLDIAVEDPDAIPEYQWAFRVSDEESPAAALAVSLQAPAELVAYGIDSTGSAGEMTLRLRPLRDGEGEVVLRVGDDGSGTLAPQTTELVLPLRITGVNRPPVAVDDRVDLYKRSTVRVAVLDNDSDPDGADAALRIAAIVRGPEHGEVSIDDDRRGLRYRSDSPRQLTDSLVYRVVDEQGGSAEATLTLRVRNRAPVVVDDAVELRSGGSASYDVLANDSDPDGDPLTLALVGTDSDARVIDGRLWYRAPIGFEGDVRIDYTADDGDGGRTSGQLRIRVERQDSGR